VMDVVYNHTNAAGLWDNSVLDKVVPGYYHNRDITTGEVIQSTCCNDTALEHQMMNKLMVDSLLNWTTNYAVDGFRFDLAPVLGRGEHHFDTSNHFFTAIKQDPILAKVKLIAEPWDIGEGGYQLGRFPNQWMEWNDRFRDTCRRFWRGDEGLAPEFAARLHGSSDIFEQPSRRPSSSVNFITSHDGFTLHDLVSYEKQQNHANGELNQDGHHSNFSSNFGVEGETDNEIIKQLRQQQKRNLLTTLFISQGTPMLLAGDEMANSQQGNNNAYCQDNETSWLNWHNTESQAEIDFVKRLIYLRKEHPLLNRTHYQHGKTVSAQTGLPDISWINCHGQLMQTSDWHNSSIKCVSMLLADTESEILPAVDTIFGEYCPLGQFKDDALLIIFNAHQSDINYALPELNGYWQILLNTADPIGVLNNNNSNNLTRNITKTSITAAAHSCVVLNFSKAKASKQENNIRINQLTPVSKEDRE